MTTCRDIITYALRMSRVIGAGASPTAPEADMGMVALQSLYDQWRTGGMFGRLADVYETAAYEAKEGERVTTDGAVITIPDTIEECGEVRAPYDLSLIETFDGTTRAAKLYDRTEWVDLLGLTLSDTAPLAGRNAYGLAAALATSGGFITMFGVQASPDTARLALQFLGSVSGKHGTTQAAPTAVYF